jgi:phage replication O-like protein O
MSHVEQGFTKIPNTLLSMMPDMTEAEVKIVFAAARKIYGWHKECDGISFSQFQRLTGLTRQSVIAGLQAAIERGILQEVKSGKRGVKFYRLVIMVGESEETSEIFETVSDATGLNSRPVSDATGLNSRPDTSMNFRPVSDATGLNFRLTKDKVKTKKREIKTIALAFSNADIALNEISDQVQTKPEITPAQVLEALVKGNFRLPFWLEAQKEEYLGSAIQVYGGNVMMDAIAQLERQYPRRDWHMFEKRVTELSKLSQRK